MIWVTYNSLIINVAPTNMFTHQNSNQTTCYTKESPKEICQIENELDIYVNKIQNKYIIYIFDVLLIKIYIPN